MHCALCIEYQIKLFFEENCTLDLTDNNKLPTDDEVSLRPQSFDEYIGQTKIKQNLKVFIQAAKSRGEALDHVLLFGSPGLGKTTLSHIIAIELGANLKITSGPAIERPGDLAAILTNLNKGDVLFVDEIHRLNRSVEEVLYPAMEDFALDIIIGKGPSARNMRLNLPPFTLIGATTRAGMLTGPLRDRFGIVGNLESYNAQELALILRRSAKILNFDLDIDASIELACRSRGTPRIANRLLKRIRDFAQVDGSSTITKEITKSSLIHLEVDSLGLDTTDRKVLHNMIHKFNGGPVGLDTLAASVGEEGVTIEDVVEPFLIQLGFIARTPKGRVVLPLAYKHLGLNVPDRIEQLGFKNL